MASRQSSGRGWPTVYREVVALGDAQRGGDRSGGISLTVSGVLSFASMTDELDQLTAALADRYRIQREIGAGGMATVYLAEDLKHRRKVALKLLRPELAAVVGGRRFLREIEIVASLRHPHILPLHDSGSADQSLYYVMPYVEGESLQQKLDREAQLPVDEAIHIARDVADALAYAHARGVVHRDIKPGNIMLESGHAVVTDFGIAFILSTVAPDRLTASGLFPGTPQYMSPEQVSGERPLDGRSDIYSLGCVLYEMLGGDPPFTGASVQAVVARKLLGVVPSLQVIRDTVSEPLERVILKALAKTPADRFKTAGEFSQALAATLVDQSAEPHLQSQPKPPPRDREASARALDGAKPTDGPGTSLLKWLGIAAAALTVGGVTLTAVGFLTTKVFDLKLRIPSQFTPSRTDFPTVGLEALLPSVIYAFVALVVYVTVKYLVRLLAIGLRRVPSVWQPLDALYRRTKNTWLGLWKSTESATIAEAFFIGAIVVGIAVLAVFWRILAAVSTAETEVLACSFRTLHDAYAIVLPVLITGFAAAWYRVFGYLRTRPGPSSRFAVARWGSMGWMIILVVIMTLPWQLLWKSERPRALLNNERAYILVETEADLVIYNAERRSTEHYRKDEAPELERQNTTGYLFEDQEAFTSSRSGC